MRNLTKLGAVRRPIMTSDMATPHTMNLMKKANQE